jgi:uncharacterized protein (DUF433 family)
VFRLRTLPLSGNLTPMDTPPTTTWIYLARKPGSSYRQLFVKGTRIAARTLYSLHVPGEDWAGMTAEEIAADYRLPVEAVREAIACCRSDPPEIRADLAMDEAVMEATGMKDPSYRYHPAPKVLSPEEHHWLTQR